MANKILARIIELAYEINGNVANSKDKGSKTPTVMVSFIGHVAMLEIRVFKDSWAPYSDWVEMKAGLSNKKGLMEIIFYLEKLRDEYEQEIEERDLGERCYED